MRRSIGHVTIKQAVEADSAEQGGATMAGSRKRKEQYWQVTRWHDRAKQSTSFCTSREGAIRLSYQTFVSGDGFPETIITPDQLTIRIAGNNEEIEENEEAGGRESLSTLWDQWLLQYPGERADWDTGPRYERLQLLAQQHVPNPRPFTSESIVANPDWYRHLYGILGMTDEMFDTFLHLHRFAVADKEAQRLSKESDKQLSQRQRTIAAIYLTGYSAASERPIVPLETQARACRAYCKRMGYKVHHIYRAMTSPPQHAPLHEEIGIAPGHAFIYYRHDSNHPYFAVHDLLAARTIDVIVEFVESGPSRSLYGDLGSKESNALLRTELASLWEIEPPTEDERQWHELLERLLDTENDEERSALREQLHVLSQNMKETRKATAPVATTAPPREVRSAVKPRLCYACQIERAREGSAFCSDKCAQSAAERYVQTTTYGWCSTCGGWIGKEGCPHSG
jgi:hypothetical protein